MKTNLRILSSTFLTLLLLPVLYEWMERKPAGTADRAQIRIEPNPPIP